MPADFYNDPEFTYMDYWTDRSYEHMAEIAAINRLLGKKHFQTAAEIGGGYGRISKELKRFAKEIILVEPSEKMRIAAKSFLKNQDIAVQAGTASDTELDSGSCDLLVTIRVMHHLPDTRPALAEFKRILKPQGFLLLEFANSYNFKARVRSIITGRPILPGSVDLRSLANVRRHSIPFVNHHPQTVLKALKSSGFQVQQILSVSNFRSPLLKKIIPVPILQGIEYLSQPIFSKIFFGPSIFILAKTVDKSHTP